MARKGKKKPVSLAPVTARDKAVVISTAQVDNPNYNPAYDGESSNPRRITATINTRECEIDYLASKHALKPHHALAGNRFRKLFERLGASGAKAIDWRKEAVDGGKGPQSITDMQLDAGRQLLEAYNVLKERKGTDGYKLVQAVAGEGRSIRDMATTRRERDTTLDILRDCLDVLAEHWGYSTRAQREVHQLTNARAS